MEGWETSLSEMISNIVLDISWYDSNNFWKVDKNQNKSGGASAVWTNVKFGKLYKICWIILGYNYDDNNL